MDNDEKLTKRVNVLLTPMEFKAAREKAYRERVKVSEVLRGMLQEWLRADRARLEAMVEGIGRNTR